MRPPSRTPEPMLRHPSPRADPGPRQGRGPVRRPPCIAAVAGFRPTLPPIGGNIGPLDGRLGLAKVARNTRLVFRRGRTGVRPEGAGPLTGPRLRRADRARWGPTTLGDAWFPPWRPSATRRMGHGRPKLPPMPLFGPSEMHWNHRGGAEWKGPAQREGRHPARPRERNDPVSTPLAASGSAGTPGI